ncbi:MULTISPECIES: hypothetical protein [unclassified Endozoicomonas]|uniref:hypothetical protein n=1 Tax=unclassified Endozoicomonas TaxID=2644528 RepID=UPI003BB0F7F9
MMVSQTNEQALGAAIEQQPNGICLKHWNRVAKDAAAVAPSQSFQLGYTEDFNAWHTVDKLYTKRGFGHSCKEERFRPGFLL